MGGACSNGHDDGDKYRAGGAKVRSGTTSAMNSPRAYDDDDEEEDFSPSLDNSSVCSNRFTVQPTSKNEKYVHTAYTPGSDADFAKWKQRSKEALQAKDKTKEEEVADDFVFGDFVIDKQDDWKKRHARDRMAVRQRGRVTDPATRPKAKEAAFVMNDFVVSMVDEGDDLEYFSPLHEQRVVPGFRHIRDYSIKTLVGHSSRVKTIAIAPNEQEYASAAIEDSHLTMTSLSREGEETGTFVGHQSPIISAVFSRDGRYLATSSRDNNVIVWNMSQKDAARKQVRTLEHQALPICVCFTSNGQYLVTGCQDRLCRVWDIESKEEVGTFDQHEGVVVCVVAVPGQDAAISGGGDKVIRMWSVGSDPQPIQAFHGHDGVVISVNVTPDGEKLLSNDDRACKMWNIATGACILNVTLESLTKPLRRQVLSDDPSSPSTDYAPPMPLAKQFVRSVPIPSKNLGYAPNGILGPQATNACKIGSNRAVFTLSCLCPGALSCSYFAVACTNKVVYVVSCATGKEELSFSVKSSVFAINAGRENRLLMGDIFGNCYVMELTPERDVTDD